MILSTTLLFWIGAVAMAIGALYPLPALLREPSNRRYYATLTAVPGIAAVAYAIMALGYGSVTVLDESIQLVRYLDWLATTPLLLLYLGLLIGPSRRTFLAMVGLDVVVIIAGVAGAVAPTPLLRYGLFGVGTVAFVGLAALLLVVIPREGADASERARHVFTQLRNVTVVLWALYPAVWLLAPTGVGLLEPVDEALVVLYLDLATKVGFVALAMRGRDAFAGPSRTEAEPTTAAVPGDD
jgi:sensory rhodopsin